MAQRGALVRAAFMNSSQQSRSKFSYSSAICNKTGNALNCRQIISAQPSCSLCSFAYRKQGSSGTNFHGSAAKRIHHLYDFHKTTKSGHITSIVRFKSTATNQTDTLGSVDGSRAGSVPQGVLREDARNASDLSASHLEFPETFEDCRVAYGKKSTWELVRALSFFFLCRFPYVTDNAVKVMELCYKVFGKKLADFLIRNTAYDQFVAGDTTHAIMGAIAKLRQGGVSPMVCVPVESEARLANGPVSKDMFLDGNLEKILDSVRLASQVDDPFPMFQFRFTALICGDLLKTISTFCTDTTHNIDVIRGISASIEGQEVDFTKLPGWKAFPRERTEEFRRGLQRLREVKDAMTHSEVIGLVDAEYTYINPAMRLLALSVMNVCNRDKARIFYTYQAYLKQTPSALRKDLEFAKTNSFCFGLKLVRGAYMVKERQLARDLGYDDPVQENFDLTCASYHDCLDLLLDKVAVERPLSIRVVIATHNEDTVRHAMKRMDELGIPRDGSSVFFGQLYGMADHVSFTLGHRGYRIYKSIPYGPLDDTLPYLARRAQENKAILVNARRERLLVAKTLRDRMLLRE